jgi:carotenoid cleavage dioxygenase
MLVRRDLLRLMGLGGLSLAGIPILSGCGGGEGGERPAAAKPIPDTGPQPLSCEGEWWVCGAYAPVDEGFASDLEVEGAIPPSLAGRYVRNGPNPSLGTSPHWFMGDGMVHGVRIEGGKALWYRGRYVQTAQLGEEQQAPSATRHPANTSVVWHGGRLLALAEVGLPYALSPEDLSTLGPHDFSGALAGAMTAHPKIDPETGELWFFGVDVFGSALNYFAVDAGGAVKKSESLPLPAPVMMHDFQLTATRVVFLDLPLAFDMGAAAAGGGMPYAWAPERGARIGVVPRSGAGAEVKWFEIDPCYVFHTVNAYDDPADPDSIVLDVVRYPRVGSGMGSGFFEEKGELYRYVISPAKGKVTLERRGDLGIELPRIDDRRQGWPHRYSYTVASSTDVHDPSDPASWDMIVKTDHKAGTAEARVIAGRRVSEVVFVPDSHAAGEDEGWLLGYAYDAMTDRSELLVLDASDIGAGPVGRVRLPGRVPAGFHGIWVPA